MAELSTKWLVPSLLSVGGIGIDFILFYAKISYTSTACPLGGSCDLVNNSVFSEMFGIPVSVFGILSFAFFLVISLAAWHKMIEEKMAWMGMAIVSGLGLLGALYFVYIMVFVLGAICTWCVFSHLILLTIFLLSYTNWKKGENGTKRGKKR
ncbi:MAG: vitamin K epoxide reductase family protein [archaeon]|mgnify:CR=1 FL=1